MTSIHLVYEQNKCLLRQNALLARLQAKTAEVTVQAEGVARFRKLNEPDMLRMKENDLYRLLEEVTDIQLKIEDLTAEGLKIVRDHIGLI